VSTYNVFATKLDPNGSSLEYSTFLSGSAIQAAYGMFVDASGDAYITGLTNSANCPLQNPIESLQPGTNAFVTEINPSGSGLVFSTFFGGDGRRNGSLGRGVAVDASGQIYVVGETSSIDFPVVPTPTRGRTYTRGAVSGFVLKIAPPGTALVVSVAPANLSFPKLKVGVAGQPISVQIRNLTSSNPLSIAESPAIRTLSTSLAP
jgi:hypothetical protein